MIVISGVLVIAAMTLLVAGIIAGQLPLIYISIGISIISALCLGIGVFFLRGELFARDKAPEAAGPGAGPAREPALAGVASGKSTRTTTAGAVPKGPRPSGARSGKSTGGTRTPTPPAAPTTSVPDDARVFVVPGRRGYHLESCRQLAGREREELTYARARREGYAACTACMPDTALAARSRVLKPSGAYEEPEVPDGPTAAADASAASDAQEATGLSQATEAAEAVETADAREASETTERTETVEATDAAQAVDATEDEAAEATHEALLETADGPSPAAGTDGDADEPVEDTGDPDTMVSVVPGYQRYHRSNCAFVTDAIEEGDEVDTMRRADAESAGCSPCAACLP